MAPKPAADNHGLTLAVKQVGTYSELARRIGVTKQSVSAWMRGVAKIRPEHAVLIEKETGVSRAQLRPDLWE